MQAIGEQKKSMGRRMCYLPLLLFGLGLCMASPLNPFSRGVPSTDSSVFLYIGKSILECGLLPYRDVFDHKGPLIYLINYLGMRLHGPTGVWFIELVLMELDVVLAFRVARLYVKSEKTAVYAAVLALLPLALYLQQGNYTEEYALPFILTSLYIYSKRIDNLTDMPKWDILILGVCCSGVLLLRPNMVSLWLVIGLVLAVKLIAGGRFFRLLQVAALFLLGNAVVLLPVLFYFWYHGALPDLIRVYLIFNMKYTASKGNLISIVEAGLTFWQSSLFIAVSLLICTIGARVTGNKSPRHLLYVTYGLFLLVSLISVSISGRTYPHYAIVLPPCFILPAAVLLEHIDQHSKDAACGEKKAALSSKQFYLLTVELLGLYMIVTGGRYIRAANAVRPSDGDMAQIEAADYIREHTAWNDRIIVMGNNCALYVLSGREAGSRYIYQVPIAGVAPYIADEFFADLRTSEPALIIYDNQSLHQEDPFDGRNMETLRAQLYGFVEHNPSYVLCRSVSDRYLIYEKAEK